MTGQRPPVRVSLDVTYACDLRCIHCRTNAGEIPSRIRKRMLSFEQITRLLRDLDDMGTFEITLTGGEPTIRKDFWRLLETVSALRFATTTLITNAVNLAAPQIDEILDAGITSVRVSVDGMQDTFARIRLVDAFDRVMENAERFNDRLGNVKILTSVMKPNVGEVLGLAEYVYDRGFRRQDLILVRAHGRGGRNNLMLSRSEALDLARQVKDFQSRVPVTDFCLNLNAPYLTDDAVPPFQDIVMYPYTVRDTSIAISATGDVTMSRLYSSAPLGNVKDSSIEEIWQSAAGGLQQEPNNLSMGELQSIFWNFSDEETPRLTSLLDRQIFEELEVR